MKWIDRLKHCNENTKNIIPKFFYFYFTLQKVVCVLRRFLGFFFSRGFFFLQNRNCLKIVGILLTRIFVKCVFFLLRQKVYFTHSVCKIEFCSIASVMWYSGNFFQMCGNLELVNFRVLGFLPLAESNSLFWTFLFCVELKR